MSRSYRKPWMTDIASKSAKRSANKAVRQSETVGNYSNFKRIFDSWAIRDYRFLIAEKDVWIKGGIKKWRRK